MEDFYEKHQNNHYILKLLEYPFEKEKEIRDCFKPFLTEDEIDTLVVELMKKFEKISEQPKIKEVQVKSKEKTKENLIIEEEEEMSAEEYEVNQDIICTNIDLFKNGKVILKDTDLKIVQNTIYGLIGKNGIGKTTLLNAIKKKFWDIPNIKIRLVKQEHFYVDKTIIDYVSPFIKENETESQKKRNLAVQILTNFGFKDVNKKICELSGGWCCRVRLAKAIFDEPDLILLDEPTNMLDLESIVFLANLIKTLKTVVVVSHDRFFLNQVSEYILEISDYKIKEWKGNYDSFVVNKKIYEEQLEKEYQKYLADKTHLQEFIDKFRSNAKRASLVQSKIKVLEKLCVKEPPKKSFFSFKFESQEAKPLLIEVKNLEYQRGDFKLKNINLKIHKNDRIVIIGDNGAGKSTFLKCLAGELEFSGEVISSASKAYFAQQHVENLPYEMNAFDFWVQKTKNDSFEIYKKYTSRMGLRIKNETIKELSGGQKSRLAFALLNFAQPNLLILDEPTNHLDMEMIEALQDAINAFEGAVISVSHDIKFIDSCFNEIYVCKNGGLEYLKGGMETFKRDILKIE